MRSRLVTTMAAAAVLTAGVAMAQTNAAKASSVGTWMLDLKQSAFGADTPPKSVTLTVISETAQAQSWRVDVIDDKGQPLSYSWSGPVDGSLQPIKSANGQVIGKEGVKRDGNALLRHGEDASDGSTFDARATMSADGNTITDVMTSKSKDGKSSKYTYVFHRAGPAERGRL